MRPLAPLLIPLAVFSLLAGAPGPARARRADTPSAIVGTVARVRDDATLVLTDGRQVRLAGILLPYPGWPLDQAAVATLAQLVEGRGLRLRPADGTTADRYGRQAAQVMADGRWVQGALLRAGLALVEPSADLTDPPDALLQAEEEARQAGRGLWALPFYAVRDADHVDSAIGRYAVVRARVVDVAATPHRVYINFGSDWRQDFTVEIDHADLLAFRRRHIDPLGLRGKLVEVRGWVESHNGPMIRLSDPSPLRLLDEGADGGVSLIAPAPTPSPLADCARCAPPPPPDAPPPRR